MGYTANANALQPKLPADLAATMTNHLARGKREESMTLTSRGSGKRWGPDCWATLGTVS